jgi:phasin family protein
VVEVGANLMYTNERYDSLGRGFPQFNKEIVMSSSKKEKMVNNLQDQQTQWAHFAAKVMENSMKMFELNARMAKESIDETAESVQHLLKAKTPDDVLKLDTEKMQEKLYRMMAYAKEINALTAEFNADLCQMTQTQFHDASKLAGAAAPASSQNTQQPFDYMYSAFGDASKGYEQWMEAGKKIAEAVEHNMTAPAKSGSKKRMHH